MRDHSQRIGRRALLTTGVLAAGGVAAHLAAPEVAGAQEIAPPLQFGRAIVPAGMREVTVRGLELTLDSIGLATSQSEQGTSCWIVLDPSRRTLTIEMMRKVKEDTPVGFLVIG